MVLSFCSDAILMGVRKSWMRAPFSAAGRLAPVPGAATAFATVQSQIEKI
jgi:hypothetical protein